MFSAALQEVNACIKIEILRQQQIIHKAETDTEEAEGAEAAARGEVKRLRSYLRAHDADSATPPWNGEASSLQDAPVSLRLSWQSGRS